MIELLRSVSLRHLIHSPVRTLLVIFGIALGVATVVATLAVNESILDAFKGLVSRVAGRADLVVTNGEAGVPAELVEAIALDEGVAHAAGSIEAITRAQGLGEPLLVLGLDLLGDRHFLSFGVEEGGEDVIDDPLAFVNDPTAVLISGTLAERLAVGVGATIELVTAEGVRPFRVRGVMKEEGLAAAFGGLLAIQYIEATALAFARGDRVDRIDVAAKPRVEIAALERRLEALVEGRGQVDTPDGRTRHLSAMIVPITRGLRLGGLVALLVGMFLIYNAVSVSVAQRRREIGVLRALGATRGDIARLFSLEAMILALVGGLLGLLLAHLLSRFALDQTSPTLSRFYAPIRPTPPRLTPWLATAGLLAGFVATLIATYGPARRASEVDPVETIRRSKLSSSARELPLRRYVVVGLLVGAAGLAVARIESSFTGNTSMFLIMVGSLFLVPALVILLRRILVPFAERVGGIPARLALDNAERSLGRSALTVGALMTAVSSSVSLSSWGESLEGSMFEWVGQSLPADLYVSAGSPLADQMVIPLRPEIIARVVSIPGIEAAYRVRALDADVQGHRIQILTLDTKTYYSQLAKRGLPARVTSGADPVDPSALLGEPAVVLSENAARKLGLTAGDSIAFHTPTGQKTFRVHSVVIDYSSDLGLAIVDWSWFIQYWRDDRVDAVDLFLRPGADVAGVAAEVRRRLGAGDAVFVTSAGELREEVRRVLRQFLQIFKSTDVIALLVALLGVVGTMLAVTIDRIREIGVLRAIGATQGQVVWSLTAEAAFLGLAAAVAGLLAGGPMGWVFVRVLGVVATGWNVEYVYPLITAGRVSLLVIGAAAIAGLLAGRRAAKMSVPESLAYE